MTDKELDKLPWYLGVYETDDMDAREACNAILLYGMPNWRERNPTDMLDNFSTKHVCLPCPTCGFSHYFKRSEWNEEHQFHTLGDYRL